MPKAIHYKHPVIGCHACGMGNPRTVTMTNDIEAVTCQRCLGTITGQKNGGRPVSEESMIKSRAAWSMPADDWEWLNRQPNKSETLRDAIALRRPPKGKDFIHVQLGLSDRALEFCKSLSSEDLSAFVEKAYAAGIRPDSTLGAEIQAIIRPQNYLTKTIARLSIQGKTITLQFPEKLDEFRSVVKGFGYEWANGFWQRTFESEGIICDHAAEIGHALLLEGFAIWVDHSEVRDRAVSGEYEPEAFRKVKCAAQKPYLGWFVFDYPRDEKHWYDKIIKITAAKYDSGLLRVPPEHFAEVEDFADQNGFVFNEKAKEALENARSLWDSALLVLPAKRKRKGGDVVNPLNNKDVVIPDALKDDDA